MYVVAIVIIVALVSIGLACCKVSGNCSMAEEKRDAEEKMYKSKNDLDK